MLGCGAREVIFTSGGSESDNLALKGVAWAARRQGRGERVVVSAVEHHAVLHAADELAAQGFPVTRLPVDAYGRVSPEIVAAAIGPDVCLVSVMLANNEVGTINPIAEIAAVARARGALLHTDAVQAAGALPLDVGVLGCDLLTLSGHKFSGPKGVGLLYVRAGVPLLPQQQGGTQESCRRAGTENVPGIVGLATALALAEVERPATTARLTALRDRLETGLRARIPDLSSTATRPNGCRGRCTSASPASRARRCCCCSTLRGLRPRPGRPAPPARPSRATSDGDGAVGRPGAGKPAADDRPQHDRGRDRAGAGGHPGRRRPCAGARAGRRLSCAAECGIL